MNAKHLGRPNKNKYNVMQSGVLMMCTGGLIFLIMKYFFDGNVYIFIREADGVDRYISFCIENGDAVLLTWSASSK